MAPQRKTPRKRAQQSAHQTARQCAKNQLLVKNSNFQTMLAIHTQQPLGFTP
jgi:hypothetical protein